MYMVNIWFERVMNGFGPIIAFCTLELDMRTVQ